MNTQFTEAVKIKNEITALIQSAGWKLFDKILEEKEDYMMQAILNPSIEISDITLREYRMAISTLRSIRLTPKAMLEDADETIKSFSENETRNEESLEENFDG